MVPVSVLNSGFLMQYDSKDGLINSVMFSKYIANSFSSLTSNTKKYGELMELVTKKVQKQITYGLIWNIFLYLPLKLLTRSNRMIQSRTLFMKFNEIAIDMNLHLQNPIGYEIAKSKWVGKRENENHIHIEQTKQLPKV